MIREWFSKYISQPIKNFYNYVTGKTSEEVDVHVNLEESVDLIAEQQDITTTPNENDIL